MASRTELTVNSRDVLGKKVKVLRRHGVTPGNIFGRGVESTAIQVPTNELLHVLKSAGRNEIVYLMLAGDEPRPTFVKHVQHHPIADNILHVDFLQISLKEKVRIDVPVHIIGLAPAVDRYGGILTLGLDHVSVEALPTDVPSSVEADVSSLEEVDSAFHVGDLHIPEGVTLLTDPDQVVAKVSPPAVVQVDVVAEPVEGEEAAAAASGEEAAAAESAE